jgi:hypothetical protein
MKCTTDDSFDQANLFQRMVSVKHCVTSDKKCARRLGQEGHKDVSEPSRQQAACITLILADCIRIMTDELKTAGLEDLAVIPLRLKFVATRIFR